MGSGWVPIYLLPVPYPCFEIEKTHTHIQTQSKREKSVKLNLIWADNHRFTHIIYGEVGNPGYEPQPIHKLFLIATN
ncbi:hypothetical protein MTR_2g025110 [Medicago truncatula]|uniref:Uncharacterized protein n=1 Tax=Medicago truncatula TaxID=3880 RepID=G7ILQ6_MEDTR|nr:hypothetical protein MTR_2g025110 [Medicago truncatula]